jgi:hypothetical protein
MKRDKLLDLSLDHAIISYPDNADRAVCMKRVDAEAFQKQKTLIILDPKLRNISLNYNILEATVSYRDERNLTLERNIRLTLCRDCEREVFFYKIQYLEERLTDLEWNKVDGVISDLEHHLKQHLR